MNIFFDTEFTGLVPNTTLISLGCITEYGEKFYAEFTDYNKNLVDDWICKNVLNNLLLKNIKDHTLYLPSFSYNVEDYKEDKNLTTFVKGITEHVRVCFTKWLEYVNPNKERIQFVSDVCHYDFYLLCNQVFGGAFNLPSNVCPWCHDICQDLIDPNDGDIKDGFDAFNYSREEACKFYNQGKLPEGKKHNALYDAEVIKMIYEGMRK